MQERYSSRANQNKTDQVNLSTDTLPVPSEVDHPAHYGSAADTYEAIKVIEAWGLGFHLGSAMKYISRYRSKGSPAEDLRKAAWYLNREADNIELVKEHCP